MLQFELPRFGQLAIARLQRRDHLAGFVAQRAGFVERRIEAPPHEAAVAPLQRQALGQRLAEPGGERGVDRRRRRPPPRAVPSGGGGRRPALRRAPAAAIRPSRTAARSRGPPRSSARRDSARVRSGAALSAARTSRRKPGSSTKNATESCRRAMSLTPGQRRGEALGEQPTARRGDGAVDRANERAFARAAERSGQFEIGARSGVDRHMGLAAKPRRQAKRRARGKLRALDIEKRRGGGGDFRAGEAAETVQRREPKIIADAPLGRGALAGLPPERDQRRPRGGAYARKAGRLDEPIRRDDLGRVDARDFGLERGLRRFADDEFARRNVERGEADSSRRRPIAALLRWRAAGWRGRDRAADPR